jgi:hypothetical protein
MKDEQQQKWEAVTSSEREETDRLRVNGGWLYRTVVFGNVVEVRPGGPEIPQEIGVAMVFVPETR